MKLRLLGALAVLATATATIVALLVVPADLNQGEAQRTMYVHVASAWLGMLSFGVTAAASVWWLWRRDLRADRVAVSAAEVGVVFTAFAIWGGMMWGKPVWGTYWQWEDPRLLTTALMLALYLGYLLLRRLTSDPVRRANRAAAAGLIAAIDLPIVHFSVTWWRGLHQTATFGSPDTLLNPPAPAQFVATLMLMLVAFTLCWGWLLARRYQLAALEFEADDRARRAGLRR